MLNKCMHYIKNLIKMVMEKSPLKISNFIFKKWVLVVFHHVRINN